MNSRARILANLKAASTPFADLSLDETHFPMTPLANIDRETLKNRFVQEAEALSANIHQPIDEEMALETVLCLLDYDTQALVWDFDQIPLSPLAATLQANGIAVAAPDDSQARVGISGAQAALAATGSLVLISGRGRYRTTSLLPPVHLAIIKENQILPHLESWVTQQRQNNLASFRQASNIVIVSGASRTADIAMELILGMHGPGELHIMIMPA
jgi:L-lactate dehydrogenase complex protein LldG